MKVHHARDAIESEAIELILLHPEAQIAHQESHNFMGSIVEETAVPKVMTTLATFMEV